jgi:hypothetical protein
VPAGVSEAANVKDRQPGIDPPLFNNHGRVLRRFRALIGGHESSRIFLSSRALLRLKGEKSKTPFFECPCVLESFDPFPRAARRKGLDVLRPCGNNALFLGF